MRKSLLILTIMTLGLCSCGQSGKTQPGKVKSDSIASSKENNSPEPLAPEKDFHTESRITNSNGKEVIIQNSYPRGGSYRDLVRNNSSQGVSYIDTGETKEEDDTAKRNYGYGIFWTRVQNETDSPLELSINFSADSMPIPNSPNSFLKLFILPETLTPDKASAYNYGIPGLKEFLDANFNEPSMSYRTINAHEEDILYFVMLFRAPNNGAVRTALVSKEEKLFYQVNLAPFGTSLIPCGKMILTNK